MQLSKHELVEMHEALKNFNNLRTTKDVDSYLVHRQAMNHRGEIRPAIYEQVMDEIDQHSRWLGKIQYAEKQRMKQLEEFAF